MTTTTQPPNNNNETNGHSGVDAATSICCRRNGHGKCPAGATANELTKHETKMMLRRHCNCRQPQPTQQSTLLQKQIVIENIGACDINMFIGNIKNKLKNAR